MNASTAAWGRADAGWLAALCLAGVALAWTATAGGGAQLPGGDAGNILAFAAGRAAPERFAGDPLLADPSLYQWYANVQVYVLAWLHGRVSDLGSAYLSLLAPTLVAFAAGMYVLGRVALGTPAWAGLFALLNFASFPLAAMGDFWGPVSAPIPRLMFQAVWPFLLAYVAARPAEAMWWPAFFVAMGLLQYVHPVSAPAVAFAACCALTAFPPAGWSWPRHFGWLVVNGALFLVLAVPFAVLYLGSHAHGQMTNSEAVLEFHRTFFGVIKTNLWAGLGAIWADQGWTRLVWVWCAAAAVAVPFAAPPERRAPLRFLALWMVILVTVCIGVTWAQQALARAKGLVPVEINMIRNLRYAVPILLLMGVAGVRLLAEERRLGLVARVVVMAAMGVVTLAWLWVYRPNTFPIRQQLQCLAQGTLGCRPPEYHALVAMLGSLREAPAGTRILPVVRDIDIPLAIRYHAFQPALYAYKDSGVFGYAAPERLESWLATRAAVNRASRLPDEAARCAAAADHARAVGADLVVFDVPVSDCAGLTVRGRYGPYTVLAPVTDIPSANGSIRE